MCVRNSERGCFGAWTITELVNTIINFKAKKQQQPQKCFGTDIKWKHSVAARNIEIARQNKTYVCFSWVFVYCSIHGYKKVNNGPTQRESALDNIFFSFSVSTNYNWACLAELNEIKTTATNKQMTIHFKKWNKNSKTKNDKTDLWSKWKKWGYCKWNAHTCIHTKLREVEIAPSKKQHFL